MGSLDTTTRKRQTGFELLRIIAMLMILPLHYNTAAGTLLTLGEPADKINVFATLVESFCISGVNTYVLISGYFMSQSKVKPSHLIKLLCQVYFYTILISMALMIAGIYVINPGESMYKLIEYFFPISSEHYWYVTAYVIMFVLSPVMNAAVEKLSRKQLKVVIMGMLLWFCVIKSFVPVMFVTDHHGYDYSWFLCLYLIAAYIRKYDVRVFYNARNSAVVYFVSCVIIFAMCLATHYYNLKTGGLIYYSDIPLDLNYFFTLTAALGLFSFFRYVRLREDKLADVIRFVAPFTFGVYLLHMHVEMKSRWVEWIEHIIGDIPYDSVIRYALHLAATVLIMFAAGVFIDWIRKIIFDFIGRVFHDSFLFRKIRELEKEIC